MMPEALAPAGRSAVSAAAVAPRSAADEAVRFSVLIFLAALLLQRFGLPTSGSEIPLSIVGPLGLLLGALWLLRGALVLDQRRVIALLALTAIGCLGTLMSMSAATARFAAVSWPSLFQFLVLSLFALLTFREAVDEERFFAAINGCILLVGVVGILQFLLQFAGISLFSFAEFGVPIRYTLEMYYNISNAVGFGGLYKANGFLVEASVYSQFMALGLAIELVYFRRSRHLAIFALGLVLSFSGTGWMVLGAFVAGAVVRLGARGLMIGFGALAVSALALGVLAFTLPDQFEYFVGRVDEFSSPGSSAHIRFVSPWWALSDIMEETPWALLVGAGAGAAERLHTQVSYLYGINSPMKVLVEYGLPGLVAYFMLFLAADRTPRQSAVMLPVMMLFLFMGTYVQFAPILFPILLITSVARLRPTPSYSSG
jgi:hypothetical protein